MLELRAVAYLYRTEPTALPFPRLELMVDSVCANTEVVKLSDRPKVSENRNGSWFGIAYNSFRLSESPMELRIETSVEIPYPKQASRIDYLTDISSIGMVVKVTEDGEKVTDHSLECDMSAFHKSIEEKLEHFYNQIASRNPPVKPEIAREAYDILKRYWEKQ